MWKNRRRKHQTQAQVHGDTRNTNTKSGVPQTETASTEKTRVASQIMY